MSYPYQPQFQPQPQFQQHPQQFYPQPGFVGGPPAAPVAPAARGTIADAWSQGQRGQGHGPAAKFPVVGSILVGVVARQMLDTDTMQETDFQTKQPKFNKDGTARWQMLIPLNVQPDPNYPEGKTTVWAKGRMLQSVIRAMQAAGYQPGEGMEAGTLVQIRRLPDTPTTFGSPAKEYEVAIQRPQGQAAPAPQAQQVPVSAPQPQAAPQPVFEQPAFAAPAPAAPQAQVTYADYRAQAEAPTTPAPAAGIPGLTPEQAALVAQLTGQQ